MGTDYRRAARSATILFLAVGCAPGSAAGQCGEWVAPFGSAPGANFLVRAVTSWDLDGEGPAPARLVAAGAFTGVGAVNTNYIAEWDGITWRPLGEGVDAPIYALTTWDSDGAGSEPRLLVAAGNFTSAGGESAGFVAAWDGDSWQLLGTGVNGAVRALTTWRTASGAELLAAGGYFTEAGGQPARHIARWDGAAWTPLADGVDGVVYSLTTWDPDADGPQPPELIAGGGFTHAGDVEARGIARCDGEAWAPLGGGVDATVYALATRRVPSEPPEAQMLIVGGSFTRAGGQPANYIASWDGTSWRPVGAGFNWYVYSLVVWDADGPGPVGEELIAGGWFTRAGATVVNRIAAWDGNAWQPLLSGMSGNVYSLAVWNSPIGLPYPHLVAAGDFATAGNVSVNNIASWSFATSDWGPVGTGMNGVIRSLASWDPDADGPAAPQLFAGGEFTRVGRQRIGNVARWEPTTGDAGGRWTQLGGGITGPVLAMTTRDHDGTGPLSDRLVAAGEFSNADGQPVGNIARWDGAGWTAYGSYVSWVREGPIRTIANWSPLGASADRTTLIAAGDFLAAGPTTEGRVAAWDAGSWSALGGGLTPTPYASGRVLTTWDPDGDGPEPTLLVVGGLFGGAGGVPAINIAAWDGVIWRSFGSGLQGYVYALETWDPDGAGPAPAQLFAGGVYYSNLGIPGIARWNGSAWERVGNGLDYVYSLTKWDPDGPGAIRPQLIAGGSFIERNGVRFNNVARWDGETWRPLGEGVPAYVFAMTTWDPDGPGPEWANLVIGGSPIAARSLNSGYLAMWVPHRVTADLDADGLVGISDLSLLLSDFGCVEETGSCRGDLDGDGATAISDLSILLTDFGTFCP